MVSFFYRIN